MQRLDRLILSLVLGVSLLCAWPALAGSFEWAAEGLRRSDESGWGLRPPAPPAPRPIAVPTPATPVVLNAQISHPYVPAGEDCEAYVHLNLSGIETADAPRPDLNLALVIDRSGSMASEGKLLTAKRVAKQVLGSLGPRDRVSVVTYANDASVLLSSLSNRSDPSPEWALDGIVARGGTNLHAGLSSGISQAIAGSDRRDSRLVLLLSDGKANQGITDPGELRLVSERAREDGVRVTSLGMGIDYDERVLLAVSGGAGGGYFHVRHADELAGFVEEELQALSRRVAADVRLELELCDGVEVLDVYGHPFRREAGRLVVFLRDLLAGRDNKLVLRLRLRGSARSPRILSCRASYQQPGSVDRLATETALVEAVQTGDPDRVAAWLHAPTLVEAEITRNGHTLDEAVRWSANGQLDLALAALDRRRAESLALWDTGLSDPRWERTLERMEETRNGLELARYDRRAQLDIEKLTALQSLGYLSH